MKKTIFLLTFLLCLPITNAQKKISLTMRDGTVLHGFGRITMNDKIKFKKSATDKKMTIYTYRKVKGVTLYNGTKEIPLEYKIVHSVVAKAKVKLLEKPVITGPVTLYEKQMEGWTRPTSTLSSVPYSVVYYHISRDGSNSVTDIGAAKTNSKRFKFFAADFFKDCPDILEKINDNYFGSDGIVDIVNYYNEKCSQ